MFTPHKINAYKKLAAQFSIVGGIFFLVGILTDPLFSAVLFLIFMVASFISFERKKRSSKASRILYNRSVTQASNDFGDALDQESSVFTKRDDLQE